jgi:hypothetical protein
VNSNTEAGDQQMPISTPHRRHPSTKTGMLCRHSDLITLMADTGRRKCYDCDEEFPAPSDPLVVAQPGDEDDGYDEFVVDEYLTTPVTLVRARRVIDEFIPESESEAVVPEAVVPEAVVPEAVVLEAGKIHMGPDCLRRVCQVVWSSALASQTCHCGDGHPESYEGPQADCPVHGAIRAFNEATTELASQADEIEQLRAALSRAEQTFVSTTAVMARDHAAALRKHQERADRAEAELASLRASDDQAVKLLEYANHLRRYGERVQGGNETWGRFDRDCEAYLQGRLGDVAASAQTDSSGEATNDNFWWTEQDEDRQDERFCWMPTLQTDFGCYSLPIWFASADECRAWVASQVVGAALYAPDNCGDGHG